MIASLPMYARASNRAALDRLWGLIRDRLQLRGVAAPHELDHSIDHLESWAHPDLCLGQICNLPYRAKFKDKVTVIGAADFGLQDCAPGYYNSVFVVRSDCPENAPKALADARFAYNVTLSQSGYGAPLLWAQRHGFQFRPTLATGSHHASIAAVAEGRGDIAAIDAQTWWIETGENPLTETLKIIGRTDSSPGMTFITRHGQDPVPYFEAIADAISQMTLDDAQTLGLKAIVALPQTAYDLPFPPKLQAIPA